MIRNSLRQRCDLRLAAAGTSEGVAILSDAGSSSRLLGGRAQIGQQVRVLDFFDAVSKKSIDILKIDIEGAEFALLADARFSDLSVQYLALEWHDIPGKVDGRAYCVKHLKHLGYEVLETMKHKGHGMLWARSLGAKIKSGRVKDRGTSREVR